MIKFIHSNPLFKYTENSCIITIQNNSKSIELTSRNTSLRQRRFVRDHALVTHWRVNNAQLPRNSEPIRLLETPRSLNEYISGTEEHTKMICWYFTNDRFHFSFICWELLKLCKWQNKVKKKIACVRPSSFVRTLYGWVGRQEASIKAKMVVSCMWTVLTVRALISQRPMIIVLILATSYNCFVERSLVRGLYIRNKNTVAWIYQLIGRRRYISFQNSEYIPHILTDSSCPCISKKDLKKFLFDEFFS